MICQPIKMLVAVAAGTILLLTTSIHPSTLLAQSAVRTAEVPATVIGDQVADIYAKVGGYLLSVNAEIGDKVTQGQTLAVLDVPELESAVLQKSALVKQAEAQLIQAQAALNEAEQNMIGVKAHVAEVQTAAQQTAGMLSLAQTEFSRMSRLHSSGSITQGRLDEASFKMQDAQLEIRSAEARSATARAEVASADAAIESAKANVVAAEAHIDVAVANRAVAEKMIEYCTIRAPFDGEVTKRFFDNGAFLQSAEGNSAAKPIFQLVDTNKVRVIAKISMTQISQLPIDQPVTFSRIDALPDEVFTGVINRRSAGVDSKTRMMRIEMDIENPDGKLKPGYFGYLKVK